MRPFFLVLAIALTACSFDHMKDQDGASKTAGGAQAVLERPVSYAEVFQAVIGPRCATCHSAGQGNQGGVNLETYESTFPLANQIQRTALEAKTMPKGSSLSSGEAQILGTWLAQGATRNGSTAVSSPRLKGPVTWAIVRDEIFAAKCLPCHSSPNPEKGLDLSSLSDVKDKIGKIFDRAVITQDMPMAPVERLTVEEKQALATWIAGGMPE